MKSIMFTVGLLITASAASATSIERAGGAKIAGESAWANAVTVCEVNHSRCFKITTEKHAAGRSVDAQVFPTGSFSISNPYSVKEFVEAQFGASHVEIIKDNGEDERDHW